MFNSEKPFTGSLLDDSMYSMTFTDTFISWMHKLINDSKCILLLSFL